MDFLKLDQLFTNIIGKKMFIFFPVAAGNVERQGKITSRENGQVYRVEMKHIKVLKQFVI